MLFDIFTARYFWFHAVKCVAVDVLSINASDELYEFILVLKFEEKLIGLCIL